MVAPVEKAFDGMIQGPHAGGEPEGFGREDRGFWIQDHDLRNGHRVDESSLPPSALVRYPRPVGPLRAREGRRHCHLRGMSQSPRHGFGAVDDTAPTDAYQEVSGGYLGLDGGPLDRPARGVLTYAGEGPRVPAAEQGFHAPDEAGLLVQAAPGDDEGPVVGPGLLFQLLQGIRAEVNARGLEEGVGTALHAPIVQLRAVPVDRDVLPAVGAEELLEGDEPRMLLPQAGDVGLVAHQKRTHVRFKVRG
jgi:hypothetical protein